MTTIRTEDETPAPDGLSERDQSGRWAPGRSGNPAGRPPGARNRRTVAVGIALAEKHERLSEAIAAQALDHGNAQAARVMIDLIEAAEEHEALQELAALPTVTRADIEALAARIAGLATAGTLRPTTAGRLLDVLAKTADLLPKAPKPPAKRAS